MAWFLGVFCLLPISAEAILPAKGPKFGIGLLASGTNEYRIGDEWGKRPVSVESLRKESPAFQRAALVAARAGGATAFYLGEFRGQHVMATNFHVFSEARDCEGQSIRFPLLNLSAVCETFLGSWDEIDLALFTVRFSRAEDGSRIAGLAGNFQFNADVSPGQKLITVGFGVAGNGARQVMANQDSDCYVFSGTGEYRLMADPDQWNPAGYRAWSFALGCDVSHGDSGSAIVDRESGKVVGIIWTGRIPKNEIAQSSQSLREMFNSHHEGIWEELSYAVPARKIGEHLHRVAPSLPSPKREILEAVLGN